MTGLMPSGSLSFVRIYAVCLTISEALMTALFVIGYIGGFITTDLAANFLISFVIGCFIAFFAAAVFWALEV